MATWFSSYRQLLGPNIVFLCRDSVLLLCHDNVATEVSLSRPRRPLQEVRCRTLHAAIEYFMSRHGSALTGVFLSRHRI